MDQIPDAPWIRDAERYGVPEVDELICPVCGKEAESFFIDSNNDIIGCDECIRMVDAYEWYESKGEEQDD